MTPFSPNPSKAQIGPIFLHGSGSSSTFTLDKESAASFPVLSQIRWKATEDVRVRFNKKRHPVSDNNLVTDEGPFFLESEGIIVMNSNIKAVNFYLNAQSRSATIYFQFA